MKESRTTFIYILFIYVWWNSAVLTEDTCNFETYIRMIHNLESKAKTSSNSSYSENTNWNASFMCYNPWVFDNITIKLASSQQTNSTLVPWYLLCQWPAKSASQKNINGVSLRHRVEIDSAPGKRCGLDLLMNVPKYMARAWNWWSSIKRPISFSRTFFSSSRSNFWIVQYPVCASQLLWGCNL